MGISDRIYRELKRRLESGIYPAGSRFPSEAFLADEFNVNKMTMNKIVTVLAGENYLVRGVRGAGTRVAGFNNLRPRGTIAFIAQLLPYETRILNGIIRECSQNNFMTVIESPRSGDLLHRLQFLKNSGVKGIISAGYGTFEVPEGMIHFCLDYDPPRDAALCRTHFMNSDNFNGGIKLVNEILRRGHREILIFSSERFMLSPTASVMPRVLGFNEALRQAGYTDIEERTFYGSSGSLADAGYFLETYLKRFPETTLIMTDTDGSAELIHKAARSRGISCPGDIALTGFGNVTLLPIATVDQNPERQGELAARYLMKFQEQGEPQEIVKEYVETQLTGIEDIPLNFKN